MSPIWNIPLNVIPASVAAMRPHGVHGHEGLALWFGKANAEQTTITHVIVPHGAGLTTHPLHLRLSMRAMVRLTNAAESLGVFWAGQIHSHPQQMLSLSEVDVVMGVQVQDYLSVVCPEYAQGDTERFDQCGVHVFDGDTYRRMPSFEVSRRIRVGGGLAQILYLEVPA